MFEGRLGFFNLISHKPTAPLQLGEPFGIRRAFTKRFPLDSLLRQLWALESVPKVGELIAATQA